MLHERIEDFVNTGFSVFLFKQVHERGQQYADMAELADAPDLGSGGNPVQVQVLLSAAWNRAVLRKLHDFFELYGRGHL